jgi:hypothetical protein
VEIAKWRNGEIEKRRLTPKLAQNIDPEASRGSFVRDFVPFAFAISPFRHFAISNVQVCR